MVMVLGGEREKGKGEEEETKKRRIKNEQERSLEGTRRSQTESRRRDIHPQR